MKRLLFALICWVTSSSLWADGDIAGFWKSISDKTGKAQCVVAIYEYKNNYYGRMIGSFDDSGTKMDDTIYDPHKRATALPGKPFYSGMDFIWGLDQRASVYKGEILNPETGDIYKAQLWVENGKLKVEGKLMMFGETQTWVPAQKSDFPPGFKMPDVTQFVPVDPVGGLTPPLY
jgi:uncharacterized protein (DUF2147 family)